MLAGICTCTFAYIEKSFKAKACKTRHYILRGRRSLQLEYIKGKAVVFNDHEKFQTFVPAFFCTEMKAK